MKMGGLYFAVLRLKGDRKGQYAISINEQWRVCFKWYDGNALNAQIIDYH
jgi:proteic killer suppression protein